ncbi:MAG: lipoprotein [Rhizobacter sp.]
MELGIGERCGDDVSGHGAGRIRCMLQQHSSVAARLLTTLRVGPFLLAIAVAGCGQKGPLSLKAGQQLQRPPSRPVTSPAAPPAMSPTDSPATAPIPAAPSSPSPAADAASPAR